MVSSADAASRSLCSASIAEPAPSRPAGSRGLSLVLALPLLFSTGLSSGPTMTNSLLATIARSCTKPCASNWASSAGAFVIAASSSPRSRAGSSACAVPGISLTAIPVSRPKPRCKRCARPESISAKSTPRRIGSISERRCCAQPIGGTLVKPRANMERRRSIGRIIAAVSSDGLQFGTLVKHVIRDCRSTHDIIPDLHWTPGGRWLPRNYTALKMPLSALVRCAQARSAGAPQGGFSAWAGTLHPAVLGKSMWACEPGLLDLPNPAFFTSVIGNCDESSCDRWFAPERAGPSETHPLD